MSQSTMLVPITLKAFKAPTEPALCAEFIAEHRKVLSDFGIPQVVTPDDSWQHDPNCHVIVALHHELGMVGGIKLQMAEHGKPLPMAKSIEKMDPSVHDKIEPFVNEGLGEVCGLWNANRFSSKGIPILMSTAVTAIATLAGAKRMCCFVAHYTQKHPKTNGFTVMEELGENGSFNYPTARIRSIAMLNPDTLMLPHAAPEQRQRIFSLRMRPYQRKTEQPAGALLDVDYRIRIDPKLIDHTPYVQIELQRLRAAG